MIDRTRSRGGRAHGALRRDILRRAALYTYGFAAAAAVIALGGAALIAWAFHSRGVPFVKSWLILTGVILLPSAITLIWRALRGETRSRNQDSGPQDTQP